MFFFIFGRGVVFENFLREVLFVFITCFFVRKFFFIFEFLGIVRRFRDGFLGKFVEICFVVFFL